MVAASEVLQVWHHEGEWQRITLNVERGGFHVTHMDEDNHED